MICAVINRIDEIRKIKVTIFTVGEYSTQRRGGGGGIFSWLLIKYDAVDFKSDQKD